MESTTSQKAGDLTSLMQSVTSSFKEIYCPNFCFVSSTPPSLPLTRPLFSLPPSPPPSPLSAQIKIALPLRMGSSDLKTKQTTCPPIWNSSDYNAQYTLKHPTSAACMGDPATATYKLPHALLANFLRSIGTGTMKTSSSVQVAATWQNRALTGVLSSNSSHTGQTLYPHLFYYPTCLSTYTQRQ